MSRPRPRPRFSLISKLAPGELRERMNREIQAAPNLRGIAFDHRMEVSIDGEEHHFWSPQLVVEVHASTEGNTRLDARFGPDPYVWALYFLGLGAMGILTFFALMFGFAQLYIGQDATALWFVPGALALTGLVYGASFVGQGLGSEQMYLLRATLTRVAEAKEEPVVR
jgi:hypothetical protein